jgi:hypothetical protein
MIGVESPFFASSGEDKNIIKGVINRWVSVKWGQGLILDIIRDQSLIESMLSGWNEDLNLKILIKPGLNFKISHVESCHLKDFY